MTRLRTAVIIGSTRLGRVGGTVGRWFAGQAEQRHDLEPAVVDLVDFDLPARYPDVATPPMVAFTTEVARADAFVVVTPEYNHSFPASLKQAIDCAYDEWRAKPVGFVSYGCGSAGLYAVEQLRVVFTELHAVTMRNTVGFDLLRTWSGAGATGAAGGGRPSDVDGAGQAVTSMLDQLAWWGLALRDARAARPYVS
jgi:NAD(P)H-dependent FMN reductase